MISCCYYCWADFPVLFFGSLGPSNKAYITDYASNTVFVIDLKTNSVIHRIKVGTNPVGISVNPISNRIYVTNVGDNTVSVIDGFKD